MGHVPFVSKLAFVEMFGNIIDVGKHLLNVKVLIMFTE